LNYCLQMQGRMYSNRSRMVLLQHKIHSKVLLAGTTRIESRKQMHCEVAVLECHENPPFVEEFRKPNCGKLNRFCNSSQNRPSAGHWAEADLHPISKNADNFTLLTQTSTLQETKAQMHLKLLLSLLHQFQCEFSFF